MRGFILFAIVLLISACRPGSSEQPTYSESQADQKRAALIHQLNHALIGVVSEDLFSPPVAGRIYAYTNIAAYEAVRHLNPDYQSLAGQLNGLEGPPSKPEGGAYWEIAMIRSYTEMAKHLVYRDFMLDSTFNRMMDTLRRQYPDPEIFEASLRYGDAVAAHISRWADRDGYNDTRNMPRYQSLGRPDTWEATAPTYGEALEPHWFKLRPFVMDSASQFRASLPMEFSEQPGSPFYRAAEEVYQIVNASKQEDIDVAVYWDCNPGPTLVDGHSMKVRKQNTPGGHWVGIHSIIARERNSPLVATAATYAKLCAAIADGFIAAWDTKFHHHLLRPETYINRHIDPDWTPKLESPLFPEFSSAHSLISAVAASVLEAEYGNVAFYDDTNVFFGLPPRAFDNLWQAAEEAARSRLLGGIHYTFGCDTGFEQGKKLGALVNERVGVQK